MRKEKKDHAGVPREIQGLFPHFDSLPLCWSLQETQWEQPCSANSLGLLPVPSYPVPSLSPAAPRGDSVVAEHRTPPARQGSIPGDAGAGNGRCLWAEGCSWGSGDLNLPPREDAAHSHTSQQCPQGRYRHSPDVLLVQQELQLHPTGELQTHSQGEAKPPCLCSSQLEPCTVCGYHSPSQSPGCISALSAVTHRPAPQAPHVLDQGMQLM